MSQSIHTALIFLISTVFDLYLLILVVRLIMVWERFDFFNPATQFIARLTDFIVKPLKRILPIVANIELATVFLILFLEMLKYSLIVLVLQRWPNFFGLAILSAADFLKIIINTFFYAILAQALLTWIQPFSLMTRILYDFTKPVMQPFQRLMPRANGIDLSPIPALILLKLLDIVLVGTLIVVGEGIAFG